MSLSKSGSINCSAHDFPAYLIHFFIHVNTLPPWLDKAGAKSSLDGALNCSVITIQILKIPH